MSRDATSPKQYPHCKACHKVIEDCGCDGPQGSYYPEKPAPTLAERIAEDDARFDAAWKDRGLDEVPASEISSRFSIGEYTFLKPLDDYRWAIFRHGVFAYADGRNAFNALAHSYADTPPDLPESRLRLRGFANPRAQAISYRERALAEAATKRYPEDTQRLWREQIAAIEALAEDATTDEVLQAIRSVKS